VAICKATKGRGGLVRFDWLKVLWRREMRFFALGKAKIVLLRAIDARHGSSRWSQRKRFPSPPAISDNGMTMYADAIDTR
jgi:hypothetical protein